MLTAALVAVLLGAAAALLVRPPDRLAMEVLGPAPGDPGNGPAPTQDPVLWLELLGSLLESGASLEHGLAYLAAADPAGSGKPLAAVASALDLGAGWDTAWATVEPTGELTVLREALSFAIRTGAPSSAILYARAAQLRRRQHRNQERKAAALGVKLVLPLGLCALPAFICLGVMPILLSLVPALL